MQKINKKAFLILGCLLIAAGIVSLVIPEKQRPKSYSEYVAEDPMVLAVNTLNGLGENARVNLIRLMIRHQHKEGGIFKIDFTLPGQKGFGDNPEFELFNNQGGGAAPPTVERMQAFSHNPQIIFTMANRIEGIRTEETDLIMVLPDLKEEICHYMRQAADVDPNTKSASSQELDLTPFPYISTSPHTIHLPENKKAGCIQSKNRLYYVYVIFPR